MFDQLSRVTRVLVRRPTGLTTAPGDSGPCPRACGVDQDSRANRFWCECPQCRPAPPGDSGLGQRAHGVDQFSRAPRVLVLVPAVWNSCPGRLETWSEGLRGRPSFPGDSARARGPVVRPALPGKLRSDLRAHGVDQLSRAIRAQVHGPAGSTSCPLRLGPGSEDPRRGQAVPVNSGLYSRPRGVNQISWATMALVRGPTGSNSSPR